MQPSAASSGAPTTTSLPPPPKRKGGSGGSLATLLAAIALALAIVAVGVSFVVPGPKGPEGGPGTGPANATYFAVVGSNGALARGSNVSSSSQTGTGLYQVFFTVYLYGCTFNAALGSTGVGFPPAGSVEAVALTTSPWGVGVFTFNATGVPTDEPFHVVATCPGGLSAVVNALGSFVSGAGVVATESRGTGAYQVLFDQDVAGCAYLAGLGASTTGSPPPGSATAAQLGGHGNGVWINTYNSAGALENATFHLEVHC